jgi:thioredoxin 1
MVKIMAEPKKGKGTKKTKDTCDCCEESCPEPRIKADKLKVSETKGELLHLTDDNFEEVRTSTPLLVIDFWAEWCGPCRMFGPTLEKFAKAHAGEVTVGKMNVDENQATPSLFDVESIPSIVFFKDGKAVAMIVGAVPMNKLEQVLEDVKNKECE